MTPETYHPPAVFARLAERWILLIALCSSLDGADSFQHVHASGVRIMQRLLLLFGRFICLRISTTFACCLHRVFHECGLAATMVTFIYSKRCQERWTCMKRKAGPKSRLGLTLLRDLVSSARPESQTMLEGSLLSMVRALYLGAFGPASCSDCQFIYSSEFYLVLPMAHRNRWTLP